MLNNYYRIKSYKRFILQTGCLFTFLIGLNVSAQSETTDLCKKIYGKWEVYYAELPFGVDPPNKNEIWFFNENGTLTINDKESTYKLEEDCSRLFIGSSLKFFSTVLHKDTLYLRKKIMVHESYVLRLKKIN